MLFRSVSQSRYQVWFGLLVICSSICAVWHGCSCIVFGALIVVAFARGSVVTSSAVMMSASIFFIFIYLVLVC